MPNLLRPCVIVLILHLQTAAAAVPTEAVWTAAADYSESQKGQTLLVLHDGKVIFERYANGGSADKLQMLASGSKSLVGLAAVAAAGDKILNLDDRASQSITEWKSDPAKSQITLRQLLSLTSGLTAGEPGTAVRGPAWADIAAKPMTGSPGKQFDYGAYQINTFAYAVEKRLNGETLEAYLKRRIFDPLGVKVEWRFKCADGHPQVGGGAFTTACDWSKIGEMVRLQGSYHGKQILDAKLLAECFHGSDLNSGYGLTWWLKHEVSRDQIDKIPLLKREWADVANAPWIPADMVAACGAGKQRLYVIPSMQLVIVRQGLLSQTFSDTRFLAIVLTHQGE